VEKVIQVGDGVESNDNEDNTKKNETTSKDEGGEIREAVESNDGVSPENENGDDESPKSIGNGGGREEDFDALAQSLLQIPAFNTGGE
jgi:hypothetical protein